MSLLSVVYFTRAPGVEFYARARRGQRIGRAAARQIGRRDGRPIALHEHGADFAEEEFAVGGELAGADAGVPKFPLEP